MRPLGSWVRTGSSDSSGYAFVVAGFVLVRLVCPCAPWESLGTFGFVWFVQVRPWNPWVHSGLSGSSGCSLDVAGFIRVRLGVPLASIGFVRVLPGGRWVLSGSFTFVLFVWVCPSVCCVRSGSSGSFRCAMGVVGFFRVRLVRLNSPWGSLGSFRFVWFVRVRSGFGRVHQVRSSAPWRSLSSSRCALAVTAFVRVRLFLQGAP